MRGDETTHMKMVALLPRLRRFALGMAGCMDQADDLVQATCERAIRSLDRFVPGTRLDSWMFKIMQNLHLNAQRDRASRAQALAREKGNIEVRLDGERAMEARLTLASAQDALASIDAEQRAALLLVAIEGFSYQEAATILDVPVGTVTSRLARARARLRAILDQGQREDGLGEIAAAARERSNAG